MVDIETPPSNGPGEPDGFDGAEEAPAMTPLALLIAEGLEQLDNEGDDAFEAFGREHPEHSDEIAASVRALVGTGLAGAGRRMGHYRIIRPLGRGGMGVVWLCAKPVRSTPSGRADFLPHHDRRRAGLPA